MSKNVFVTVGSTHFNDLIEEVTQSAFLKVLYSKGYKFLSIQIGKGTYVPDEGVFQGVNVEVFRYKETLKDNFERSDLVISHAGAGSCIEALECNKPLIAVINHSLMNNHQIELAEALAEQGFSKWCYTDTLLSILAEFDASSLTPYTPGEPCKIVEYIDSVFKLQTI
ncbi:UNVERIFIED_CONTAM: hypothetical protein GTU68_016105 [Idotea baltica]|nr:hypothetical protein [Idotea baltica]